MLLYIHLIDTHIIRLLCVCVCLSLWFGEIDLCDVYSLDARNFKIFLQFGSLIFKLKF